MTEVLPDGPVALYRLFDRAGTLAYVGIADHPAARWRRHARESSWWNDIDESRNTVRWYDTRGEAKRAELRAIATEKPRFNITGRTAASDRGGRCLMPAAHARTQISEIMNAARDHGRHTVVLRHGEPAVVFLPAAWYHRASAAIGDPWEDWEPEES